MAFGGIHGNEPTIICPNCTIPANVPGLDGPVPGEIVRRLIEVYHPERIYLFGSAARGEAGPDSDYDFTN